MHRVQLAYTLADARDTQRALHHPLLAMLAALHATGSISAAARALGLSYRHVWGELKRWEAQLGQPLVLWSKGQPARLTPFGEKLLWAERRALARLAPQIEALRSELERLDSTLPLYNVQTLSDHMSVPLFPFRMAATVLGSFGILAIVLAAIGIYGVMSYVVAGRTREIGVRIALGAARRDVLLLIIKQGMTLAVIGLGIGLLTAFGVAQLLANLLFGISAVDPLTFAGVALLLALVAALACYVPARRATKVDPLVALHYE